MAGLTTAGFRAKTQDEILEEVAADIKSELGADVDVDPESPLGQFVEIFAAHQAELWAELENVHTGGSVLTAGGVPLVGLAAGEGLTPHPARASTVVLDVAGTTGFVVGAGSAVTDPADIRWVIVAPVTIGSTGTAPALFRAEVTGPAPALAGTVWTIATPASDWTGATNAADADLGRDVETPAELRSRTRSSALRGTPSGIDGLRAQLLRLTDVTEAIVIENETKVADADGRPPTSLEAVVRGGTDAEILQAVWTYKPGGIEATTTVSGGNQISGTVVDATGTAQPIVASRPDEIPIYVEVDYTPMPSAPTSIEADILQAILDFGELLTLDVIGVYPPNVEAEIFRAFVGPVFSFFTLRMGLSASPVSAVTVPTSRTQLAAFDSSRISITKV